MASLTAQEECNCYRQKAKLNLPQYIDLAIVAKHNPRPIHINGSSLDWISEVVVEVVLPDDDSKTRKRGCLMLKREWNRFLTPILREKDQLRFITENARHLESCLHIDSERFESFQNAYPRFSNDFIFILSNPNAIQSVVLSRPDYPQNTLEISSHDLYNVEKTPNPDWCQPLSTFSRYTPLNEVIHAQMHDIYAVVWEALRLPRQCGPKKLWVINAMIVDDSLRFDPKQFYNTNLFRYSLCIVCDQLEQIPVFTSGDIIRIHRIKAQLNKSRFIDLSFLPDTSVRIWKGDMEAGISEEDCIIMKNQKNVSYNYYEDRGMILRLKNWSHSILTNQNVFTNKYLLTLNEILNSSDSTPIQGDLIAKIVKFETIHHTPVVHEVSTTSNSTFLIYVEDGTVKDTVAITNFDEWTASYLQTSRQHLQPGEWIRICNIHDGRITQTLKDDGSVRILYMRCPYSVRITRLPSWCKDVKIRKSVLLQNGENVELSEEKALKIKNLHIVQAQALVQKIYQVLSNNATDFIICYPKDVNFESNIFVKQLRSIVEWKSHEEELAFLVPNVKVVQLGSHKIGNVFDTKSLISSVCKTCVQKRNLSCTLTPVSCDSKCSHSDVEYWYCFRILLKDFFGSELSVIYLDQEGLLFEGISSKSCYLNVSNSEEVFKIIQGLFAANFLCGIVHEYSQSIPKFFEFPCCHYASIKLMCKPSILIDSSTSALNKDSQQAPPRDYFLSNCKSLHMLSNKPYCDLDS